MKPTLLLSLWRERWGKPSGDRQRVHYVDGKLSGWGTRLALSAAWSPALVRTGTAALCLWALGILVTLRFSLHDQVVVSAVLASAALFLRRYAGTPVTLAVAILSLIASLRYLGWRLTDTLPADAAPELVMALALFIAEAFLALKWATSAAHRLWPLLQPAAALPTDQDTWPTVDVFLPAHGQSPADMQRALAAASAWSWPRGKRRVCLLDEAERGDMRALAERFGAHYLVLPGAGANAAQAALQALRQSHGDLAVIADSRFDSGADFLREVCGWFARDPALGMLATPQHPFAPQPAALGLRLSSGACAAGAGCVLLRRAALEPAQADATQAAADLAALLAARQYRTACLAQQPGPSWARLDNPFSQVSLRARLALQESDRMLQSCGALANLVLLAAPLGYLILGAELVATRVDVLAAFAIPHLLHAYLLHARLREDSRLSLWAEIRELLFAGYLLLPTALNTLRAGLAGLVRARPKLGADRPARFAAAFAALCAVALAAGLHRLTEETETARAMTAFYMGWCAANMLMLLGALAVAREAAQVRHHAAACAAIPAMLRLPYGRTVSCTTTNFPAPELELLLPAGVQADGAGALNASLFAGQRVFPCTLRVLGQRERILLVRVADDELAHYKTFAAGVLARGRNWPNWLAGRHADRPIPAWVTNGLSTLAIGVLDFFTNIEQHARWLRPHTWMSNRKKQND